MRSTSLKLALTLSVLAFIAGCSSTKTDSQSSTDKTGATTSGASSSGVKGSDVSTAKDGSVMIKSSGNIVYFDFDQDTIRPDARDVLMTHAARLKSSGAKATLEGHCDERGTREYNMALGERRAKAVRDFLVIQGVNKSQLEVVSYGEERPADAAHTEEAWAKNRRVEIK